MLLIADSGSTKCDWILLKNNDIKFFKTRTKGLNPSILTKEVIKKIIKNNEMLSEFSDQIKSIYFFGAGCNTSKNKKIISNILTSFFSRSKVLIEEDTMGAVWATTNKPAVVCILGTGSNSCYYDGKTTHSKVPSLGYLVMDEGSGNYFGKELFKSYYYKQMPENLRILFEKEFNLKKETVIENLYKSDTPNKYLAQFAPFIFTNKEDPFISQIIKEGINKFIENHLLQYTEELKSVPIHFVGSIAYLAQDFIMNNLKERGLIASRFVKRPIHNLVNKIKEENYLILN